MAEQTLHRIDVIKEVLNIKDKIIQKQDEKIKKQKKEIEYLLLRLRHFVLKENPNISVPNAYGIGMEDYEKEVDKDLEEIEKLKAECNEIFKKELDL